MISIVVMEIANQGNLGAIARAMKNFGFDKLVLIDPKCTIGEEARKRAKHAGDILKKAGKANISVLKKFDYVIGTTARMGTDYNVPRSPLTPEQLGKVISEKGAWKKKIAILIGREGDGLTNGEVDLCDFVVTIPTSKKYPAMNISHACSLILYELNKAKGKESILSHITPSSKREKDQLFKTVNEVIDSLKFATENRRSTQKKVWKRLIGKSFLTKREAFALIGFFKKLKK